MATEERYDVATIPKQELSGTAQELKALFPEEIFEQDLRNAAGLSHAVLPSKAVPQDLPNKRNHGRNQQLLVNSLAGLTALTVTLLVGKIFGARQSKAKGKPGEVPVSKTSCSQMKKFFLVMVELVATTTSCRADIGLRSRGCKTPKKSNGKDHTCGDTSLLQKMR